MCKFIAVLGLMFLASFQAYALPDTNKVTPWDVIKIDVAMHKNPQFSRSVRAFFYEGKSPPAYFTYQKVNGDAGHEADLNGFDVAHVDGHLKTDVVINDHAELVIAGDVFEEVFIESEGINNIYIGGDFRGTIRSSGSLSLIVEGHFEGKLVTGHPSTVVKVQGDYKGTIEHEKDRGALLYLTTNGYVSEESVDAIFSQNYTMVEMRTNRSEIKRGIYYRKHGLHVVRN